MENIDTGNISQLREELETTTDKRKFLSGISNTIKPLIKAGVYDSVNEALKEIYLEDLPEGTTFNTFHGWKKEGKRVKKGEKAYLVWGTPKNLKKREIVKEGKKDEFEYFPLAYLFASHQVQDV